METIKRALSGGRYNVEKPISFGCITANNRYDRG